MSNRRGILVFERARRVESKRDPVCFKRNDGRVMLIVENQHDDALKIDIGEETLLGVIRNKSTYSICVVKFGSVNINDFVNNIPNLTLHDISNFSMDEVTLVNTIMISFKIDILDYINNEIVNTSNLRRIKEFFDKHGIRSERSEWTYDSLFILQYAYDKLSDED